MRVTPMAVPVDSIVILRRARVAHCLMIALTRTAQWAMAAVALMDSVFQFRLIVVCHPALMDLNAIPSRADVAQTLTVVLMVARVTQRVTRIQVNAWACPEMAPSAPSAIGLLTARVGFV